MNLRVLCILVLLSGFTTSIGRAEAFNIDFGNSGGVPGRGFSAASTGLDVATFWNIITADDLAPTDDGFLGPEVELVDEFSLVSPVTLQLFVQSGGSATIVDPGFGGDAAGLLSDGLSTTDIPMDLTFRNLAPGAYRVTAYGAAGNNAVGTFTGVNGDINGTFGGQAWTGDFIQGQTHHQEVFVSDDGEIEFTLAAAEFGGSAILTGIQIASVPEPTSMSSLIAAMGCLLLAARTTRRMGA